MRRVVLLVSVLLFLAGCGLFRGGEAASVRLDLDEAPGATARLKPGETLLLDVRHPGDGGYQFSGASFDPSVLRLDKFWTEPPADPKPGDFGRAYFVFTAVQPGSATVEIRIKRPWEKDSAPEVYRSVKVEVAAPDGKS